MSSGRTPGRTPAPAALSSTHPPPASLAVYTSRLQETLSGCISAAVDLADLSQQDTLAEVG